MYLDERSQMALYRLMNRRVVDNLGPPIKQGKESLIVHATSPDGADLAVKIHSSRVFGEREKKQYIFGDWRFRHAKRHITLRTDEIWAEKEHRNLARLEKQRIPAPKPVAFESSVVVMGYIGRKMTSAPQLNELEDPDFGKLSDSILVSMTNLVSRAELVHGDLSPYNILVWEEKPFLIDLSQAVLVTHPEAQRLLESDVEKMAHFFAAKGVDVEPYHHLREELVEIVRQDRER